MSARRKIGAVSYLNTKPLVHQLETFAPDCDLVFDLPSRLADRLDRGELDVALIPSIEFLRHAGYRIVSDACIGCRGPVLSVKLLSRTPISQIKSLALDEGSRTSVALVRILLKHRFGLAPSLQPLPIGCDGGDTETDAVLLIGDRAMHPTPGEFAEIWDLGDEWCRWSELPFVFAMWVAREDARVDDLEQAFSKARDLGVAHLEEISQREAEAVGLTSSQCHSYLRDNLYFFLGPREHRGLALFFEQATELEPASTLLP